MAIRAQACTMQQALQQWAAQANVSLLADGNSDRRPQVIEIHSNAEEALSQIAEAFDYSWSVSKSGFILMRKRFTDEFERPEIVVDEMRASTQDILGFLPAFYTPQSGVSMTDAFRRLAAELSPEEARLLASGAGLPVSMLNARLREQARHILYMNDLDSLSLRLNDLDRILAALPTSRITVENRRFVGGKTHRCGDLVFAGANAPDPFYLWQIDAEPGEEAGYPSPLHAPVSKSAKLPFSPLSGYCQAATIRQALSALETRFHIKVMLLPQTWAQRRILLLLRDADASFAPAVFAEMYNMRLQQKSEQAYFLYRRPIEPPNDIMQLGSAILQTFPADVVLCLFARPATLNGDPYIDVYDRFPQLPGKGDTRPFAATKVHIHYRAALQALQRSLGGNALKTSTPYAALTAQQQRDLLYSLWSFTASQFVGELWEITSKPPSYMADPLNVRLLDKGSGRYGILGSGGGSLAVSGGLLPTDSN